LAQEQRRQFYNSRYDALAASTERVMAKNI